MQSSPPPPRPPPHRTQLADEHEQSQYSLDLDALTLDGENSILSSPSVHQVVDRIKSDDIDGPTDFTVNLAKYFKGSPQKQPLPTWHNEQDMFDDESAHFLSHPSPEKLNGHSSPSAHAETPHPATSPDHERKRNTLQPTVEDYYSELTPGLAPSVTMTPESTQRRSYSTSRLRQSSNKRPSSPPTLSTARSPYPNFGSTPDKRSQSLEQELQRLSHANHSLRRQLESERAKDQHSDSQELDALRNELDRLHERSHHYQDQVASLQEDLEHAQAAERDALRLAQDRAKELDQMHDTEDDELHNLRVQLNHAREAEHEHANQLDQLKNEIETKQAETTRLRTKYDDLERVQHKTEAAMKNLLEKSRESDDEKNEDIARLKHELAHAREQAQMARDDYDEDIAVHHQKVDKQTNEPKSEGHDELERQVSSLQHQLDDANREVEKYKQELERLKADSSRDELEHRLQEALDDLAAKDKLIESARGDADRKTAAIEKLEQQLDEANEELGLLETSSKAESKDKTASKADKTLQQLEQQLQKARNELSTLQSQYASDKETWSKAESDARTSTTQANWQIKKEQEARKTAEQEASSLRDEIDMLQHFDRMSKNNTSQTPPVDLAEALRKELQALHTQMQDQRKQNAQDMQALRKSLNEESSIRAEHRRTIDLIEEGMASLRTSRDELRLRVNELEPQLSSTRAELQSIQSALTEAQAELATATSSLDDAESQRTSLETELEAVKKELSELHTLNAEFDTKLSEKLKKREESWTLKLKEAKVRGKEAEEKAAALEEERKTMARALMGFWGKEDCGRDGEGDGEGQRFKYRFAKT